MWMTHLLRPDVIVQNHGSIKVTAFRSFLSCQTAGINEDFPVVDEWYGVGDEDDQQGEADDDNDDVVWCAEEEVVEKETKADNEHHGVTGCHQPRSSRCVHRQSCLINLLKKHTYILRYLMTTQTDFESMRVFKSHQGPSFDGGAILTSHESLSVTLKCLKYATHAHEQSWKTRGIRLKARYITIQMLSLSLLAAASDQV